MRLKSFISKGLALGLIVNNFAFLSNTSVASSLEVPNRYETLEGEDIIIDDSMEGKLLEIEIFGSTVQDTGSKNLFSSPIERGAINVNGVNYNADYAIRSVDYINVKSGTTYSTRIFDYDYNGSIYIHEYDKDYVSLKEIEVPCGYNTFTTSSTTKYIKISTSNNSSSFLNTDTKIQLNEGNKLLEYDEYRAPNLEDIQSIGDLYTDKNGNPILDSQGREQYKIDIVSANYNRLYKNEEIVDLYNNMGYSNVKAELTEDNLFKIVVNGAWQLPNKVFKGKPNTEYTFSYLTRPSWIYTNGLTLVQDHSEYVKTYRTDSTGEFGFLVSPEIGTVFDFKIYEGNVPDIDELVEGKNKTTILLPTQLQKVGDVADRLYWDDEKGRYVIEKNIISTLIDSVTYGGDYYSGDYSYVYWVDINYDSDLSHGEYYRHGYMITGLKDVIYSYFQSSELWSFDKYGAYKLLIRYPKEERFSTVDKMLSYLSDNNVKIYYQNKNAEVIDTNITSKLKIPTYDGKTYVFVDSENGINPTLKVTVDRINKIVQDAVDSMESMEVENVLTTENLSLTRAMINQMEESILKDQLQERLNSLFSFSDIQLERKNISSSMDVYIKSENALSMSLSTSNVTFENYSGVEDMEKLGALDVIISSTLPYDLNSYLESPIQNSDGSEVLDIDVLKIKESSKSNYNSFVSTTHKVILKDGCGSGNNISHSIDLKLSGSSTHTADIYKTVIKFEAEQR